MRPKLGAKRSHVFAHVKKRILAISIALCFIAGTIQPGFSLQYSAEIYNPPDFNYIKNKLENPDSSLSAAQKSAAEDFLLQLYGSITVLNEHSYPTVGQYWIINFTTQGTHDLKISAVNGTSFGNATPYDVEFFELYSGTSYLQPQMTDGKIIIENYTSEQTGHLKLKVHTAGQHHIMFEFGNDVAYAHNTASPKSTTAIESGTTNGPTLADFDRFGTSVAGIGDLDGDGIQDIVVGAAEDDTGGADRGAVYIILMNANGTPKSTTKIASGTTNGPTLADSDLFGFSVAGIGDIDGDGVPDIAAGAAFDDTGGTTRGAVYIILMNANGTPKSTTKIASDTANFTTLANFDRFGRSVAGISDIDRDGIPDIAAGADLDDTGGSNRGAVYIILMNANGTPKSTTKIASDTANFTTLANDDGFGRSVAGIGDIDRDGIQDIAAGATGDDADGSDRGAVYIILMNANGTPKSTTTIESGTANFTTLANFDNFGVSVAGIGDIDRDGIPDIAAGAEGDETGGADRGAVYIILMNANGTPKSTTVIESGTANGPTLADTDLFGTSVAGIGDIDRDGIPDIAAGANGDDTGGTARGAVYIIPLTGVFPEGDGSIDATTVIESGTTNGPTLANFDNFGVSVAGIGDIDRDGIQDIAAGASGDDTGGSSRGAVYIILMNANGTPKSTTTIESGTANGPTLANDDFFGTSVTGIGDIDRDGIPDIAVGASGDNTGGTDRGATYIILMNANGTPKSTTKIASGTANFVNLGFSDAFGRSVAGIGDLDRDGIPDIAAGANGDDAEIDEGAVYVILMNANGTPKSTTKIESGTANFVNLGFSDFFGTSVTGIGDIDRDGIPDIAVGASGDNTGGTDRGTTYIILMNADGTPKSTTTIESGTANGPTLANDDFFGGSVTGIGDLDRDGIPDIAAGADSDNTGGSTRGAVYIILMNANGTPKSTTKIASGTANGPTLADDDNFGFSVAGIGDLDGDGIPDIAAGAINDDTGGTNRGAAYIIFFAGTTTPVSVTLSDSVTISDSISTIVPAPSTGGPDHFGYTYVDSNDASGPTFSWVDITSTGTEILPDTDDDFVENISIGFTFEFYGIQYTTLSITSNGLVLGGAGTSEFVNQPIGSSTPNNFMAPYWDDLVTWLGPGAIYYKTQGTAPNRVFIVEWFENQHFFTSTSTVTFEIILHEGSNDILFQYLDVSFGTVTDSTASDLPPYDNGGSATVGIEDSNGQGLQYSFNQQAITPNLAILFEECDCIVLSDSVAISDTLTTQVTFVRTVGAGGTATIPLPSGTTFKITLPPGGTVTTLTTPTEDIINQAQFSFAGEVIDVIPPAGACTTGCDITFELTQAQITAAGETTSTIRIFHDVNNDNIFAGSNEIFVPIVTDLGGGLFSFTANIPFTSKFAVGGIRPLFLGGLSGEFAPPTFTGKAFAENEYPLTINGLGYKLDQYSNTISTISLETGNPVQIKTLLYDPGGVTSIQHLAMYMNLRGMTRDIQYSDTYIIYDKSVPTQVSDPNEFFDKITVTPTQVGNKLELSFDITFAKPMEKSDIMFRMWDDRRNNVDTKVFDAIVVTGPEVSSAESAEPVPTLESIKTKQTAQPTESAIPSWIKSNAGWWSDGQIGDSDFVSGIQYLINQGIMTIPETEAGQSTTQQIPAWIKSNAKWWSDGLISDSDFVQGIQWLISNGIMKV